MKAGDNPFRTERLERVNLHLPDGVTWAGLLFRLRELKYRAAIVGPHGSGKTTFLEHLAPFLSAEGFQLRGARLDEQTRTFSSQLATAGVRQPALTSADSQRPPASRPGFLAGLGAQDLLLLDGAEQLNLLRWLFFRWRARAAGGLIITTHRAGRLPTLIEFRPTVQLLGKLICELSADACCELNTPALFSAHDGNLRHALLACYDHCARL
jgi:energy-coupling factor transporter ATP-binding protein EcfA2